MIFVVAALLSINEMYTRYLLDIFKSSEGVSCHIARGRVRAGSPILRPLSRGVQCPIARARVYCANQTRHIGLNGDYNMTF